jgi:hypothetical protein
MKGPAVLRGRDVGLSEFFAKMVEFEAGGEPRWSRPAIATDSCKDRWRDTQMQRPRAADCSVKCTYDLKCTTVQPPIVDNYYFASGNQALARASDAADSDNIKQHELQKLRCHTADGRRKAAMRHSNRKSSTAGDKLLRCYSAKTQRTNV